MQLCSAALQCSDGDNDNDNGLVGCDDPDCAGFCSDPECDGPEVSLASAGCGLTVTGFVSPNPKVKKYGVTEISTPGCDKSFLTPANGFGIECDCSVTEIEYTLSVNSASTTHACTAEIPEFSAEECEVCEE